MISMTSFYLKLNTGLKWVKLLWDQKRFHNKGVSVKNINYPQEYQCKGTPTANATIWFSPLHLIFPGLFKLITRAENGGFTKDFPIFSEKLPDLNNSLVTGLGSLTCSSN